MKSLNSRINNRKPDGTEALTAVMLDKGWGLTLNNKWRGSCVTIIGTTMYVPTGSETDAESNVAKMSFRGQTTSNYDPNGSGRRREY